MTYLGLRYFIFLLLFLFLWASALKAQIITTYAGNGTGAETGDGGLATAAEVDLPIGLAIDKNSNLYICDSGGQKIRIVNPTTNIINTYAGNGTYGGTGDGGLATSAEVADPYGIALDSSGNLYIADLGNYCVRMVNAVTGIITTVAGTSGVFGDSGAGGPATSAEMGSVVGVAVDPSNNIFIADTSNCRIWKVTAGTGILTSYAGDGTFGYTGDNGPAASAELSSLDGVGCDPSGNVYIIDQGNDVIRKVTAATGIITTFAGTGVYGFSGDGGPATSATFDYVGSVYFDPSGIAYLTDEVPNYRIRKVDTTGIITTIVGNGIGGFSGDGGPPLLAELNHPEDTVSDSAGNFFIADWANNRVRKVTGILFTPTYSNTPTSTVTPTCTPTNSPTCSPTNSPTSTVTRTSTVTCTETVTSTTTSTSTVTATQTQTCTSTATCVNHIWPDPYNPKTAVRNSLKIDCLLPGDQVMIFTISGELVKKLQATGVQLEWNGRNTTELPVATGIYYYVIEGTDNKIMARGKFLIVNGS